MYLFNLTKIHYISLLLSVTHKCITFLRMLYCLLRVQRNGSVTRLGEVFFYIFATKNIYNK